jgi:hypothetical protein
MAVMMATLPRLDLKKRLRKTPMDDMPITFTSGHPHACPAPFLPLPNPADGGPPAIKNRFRFLPTSFRHARLFPKPRAEIRL